MLVIPAIDLQGGKVVRLTEGSFDQETVYSRSPAAVMEKWQRDGAQLVHIVDLDGAREGVRRNLGSLKNILAVAKIRVQFGGGLRTYETCEEVLRAGVWRVVVGTKAFDSSFIRRLVMTFKERVAIGLDVRDGAIQTHGWQTSDPRYTLETFCRILEESGIRTIVCTDVGRDGTMKGPNIELLDRILAVTRMNVVISGGVSSLSDLKRLATIQAPNFEGVIIGKALYEQKVNLRDAIMECEGRAV